MGIETIITCARCERVIDSSVEDYGHVRVEYEIDHNVELHRTDERASKVVILCEPCMDIAWPRVVAVVTLDLKGGGDGD